MPLIISLIIILVSIILAVRAIKGKSTGVDKFVSIALIILVIIRALSRK